jgi:proline iminopeptidase
MTDVDVGTRPTRRLQPLSKQMLPVGDGHELYVETVGHAGGRPAVYLHGGPGSGCQPDHRQLFDPPMYRSVLFDQRGCGLSQPKRSREANTTDHLVADLETIREALGIERWLVVGGSWGATLALAYAQRHPDRVTGIVLRSTFLGTRDELDQAFLNALPRFYPGLNEDFLSLLSPEERTQPLEAYWRRILDPDPNIHRPAAHSWHDTERILSEIKPGRTRLNLEAIKDNSRPLPATSFMEAHYFHNACFMSPDQLMTNATKLIGIRGIIVQGRYDLLCPVSTAHALAAVWQNAELRIVEGAGHSLYDPGIRDAVVTAIAEMAR